MSFLAPSLNGEESLLKILEPFPDLAQFFLVTYTCPPCFVRICPQHFEISCTQTDRKGWKHNLPLSVADVIIRDFASVGKRRSICLCWDHCRRLLIVLTANATNPAPLIHWYFSYSCIAEFNLNSGTEHLWSTFLQLPLSHINTENCVLCFFVYIVEAHGIKDFELWFSVKKGWLKVPGE